LPYVGWAVLVLLAALGLAGLVEAVLDLWARAASSLPLCTACLVVRRPELCEGAVRELIGLAAGSWPWAVDTLVVDASPADGGEVLARLQRTWPGVRVVRWEPGSDGEGPLELAMRTASTPWLLVLREEDGRDVASAVRALRTALRRR